MLTRKVEREFAEYIDRYRRRIAKYPHHPYRFKYPAGDVVQALAIEALRETPEPVSDDPLLGLPCAGAAAFLALALTSFDADKGYAPLHSWGIILFLLGLAFVVLTLISALVWAASRGRYATRRAVGLLFVVGMSALALGFFLSSTYDESTAAGSRSGTSSLGGQGNSALSGSLRNEFGVYGLQLGDSQDKVISRLGAPTRKDFQRISQGTAGSVYDYGNQLSFTFLNGRIINISSRDPEFGTKRGASIGDSFDRVLSLYRGYSMNTNQDHSALLLRDRDSNLLLFTFSCNRLNSIQLLDTKGMNAISNSIWDAVFGRSIKINPDGTYQYPGSLN